MPIKIKNRDPKKTDFASDEIIINRKDGTLFFKSEKELLKIQGNDVSEVVESGGGSADNLGNHTATQDLNMGGFNINNSIINGGSF